MCYSASASFIASGVLTTSGIAIARTPKENNKIPLSLFPIIFAVHQLIEGILWLTATGVLPGGCKTGAVYGYASIAFVLWPVYVPFSVFMIETGRLRRWIIMLCQIIGLYVGGIYVLSMLQNPVDAVVMERSIAYTIKSPYTLTPLYLSAVSIPFLISSDKKLIYFGFALTISCAAAMVVANSYTFPSVWCFFAAILSFGLLLYFKSSTQERDIVRISEVRRLYETIRHRSSR